MQRLAFALVLSSSLAAAPARAEPPSEALAWGVATGELAVAGVLALNFGTDYPTHGPALIVNFAPLVLAGGAAWGAHATDLDPRPALALHGGAWFGLELFMLGALIDGRDEPFGLRAGTVAWTLGAIGTLAGGVLGATAVDDADRAKVWLGAPGAGFLAGGLVLGGVLVLASGLDGGQAPGRFAVGAAAGLAIGLGAATYYALRDDGDDATPRLDPGPRRFVLSFGGAF